MKKNPGIAALLSFIIPGAGMVYCENIVKGILTFVIWGIFVRNGFAEQGYGDAWIAWLITFLIWVFNIYASMRMANKFNDRYSKTNHESQSL